MLISFSVENFRSFGEEQTLNMVASQRLGSQHSGHTIPIGGGRSVLRTAVLYGANAAGKSNLVNAMRFAQHAITEVEAPSSVPFVFDRKYFRKPSSFEFRFLIQDRIFTYGFDIDRDAIQNEWLSVNKGDADLPIFERDATGKAERRLHAKNVLQEDWDDLSGVIGKLDALPLKPNQLFLNRASALPPDSQGRILHGIIQWLTEDLLIVSEDDDSSCETLDRLDTDRRFLQFCKRFLHNVGTGVAHLQVMKNERPVNDYERRYVSHLVKSFGSAADRRFRMGFNRCLGHSDVRLHPEDPNKVIERTLVSGHTSEGAFLPFAEESDGTRNLLDLMALLAPPEGRSRVIVIDELDRSLHPLLCREIIRFFSESCPGVSRQLIVTTHEAHLLDQDLLRRDEYWFVEKDPQQQSRLVSLDDFKVRKDLKIEKGYLQGRFGAIPLIGGMEELERLLSCDNESESVNASQAPTS